MARPEVIERKRSSAVLLSTVGLIDPTPIEEICEALILASIPVQLACDPIKCQPDRAFAERVTLKLPRVPEITVEHVKMRFKAKEPQRIVLAISHALQTQAEIVSYEYALLTTVFRKFSAERAGDRPSAERQRKHLRELKRGLRMKVRDANLAWDEVASVLRRGRVRIPRVTPRQVKTFKRLVWQKGFPKLEVQFMKQVGLTDYDINWLRALVQDARVPARPVSFLEMIHGMKRINEENPCDCSCIPG